MRTAAGAAASLALAASGPAGAADLVALFRTACLEQFPRFERSAGAFARAGWAETETAGPRPARSFAAAGAGLATVETDLASEPGPMATCTILADPLPAGEGAMDRIGGLVGGAAAPDCFTMSVVRSCTWMWPAAGGCRGVIATTTEGSLASLVALSFEAAQDCREDPR